MTTSGHRLSRLYHHIQRSIYSRGAQSQDQFPNIINSSRRSQLFSRADFTSSQDFQHSCWKPLSLLVNQHKSIGRNTCSSHSSLRKEILLSPTFTTQVRKMSTKHLATGATCPPLSDGKLRIYSMLYCPFAQRARLVAEAKGISYDVVNCNLKAKPEFLLERNPQGEVPVVETTDGKVLYESLIVSEYLEDAFADKRPLHSKDPFKKAIDNLFISKYAEVVRNFYRFVFGMRDSDGPDALKEKLGKLVDGLKPFEDELARRGTPFFFGDQPGMIDYMIWPWMERIPMIKLKQPDLFDYEGAKKQNPNLENWRQAMKKDPTVAKLLISPEDHLKFAETYLTGNPVYDFDQ